MNPDDLRRRSVPYTLLMKLHRRERLTVEEINILITSVHDLQGTLNVTQAALIDRDEHIRRLTMENRFLLEQMEELSQ